ncbi:unnamed protein product [Onchocerca flexuosa]|uniref:Ras-GAP domain-containing protein n=1 Tax=Onchocerca flexuosa TaxID=387005 RepID=A0A183H6T2_9BILA|nr:unnamed protein product [Onchocerca flexuosa]
MYDAWAQIARALFYQYGNAFSFLTLLDALCSDFVKSIPVEEYSRTLQQELESVACKLHRCEPLPLSYPEIIIPFMQPLLNILSNNLSSLDDVDYRTTWATDVGKFLRLVRDTLLFQNPFACYGSISLHVYNLWKWLQEGRRWIKRAIQLDSDSSKLCNGKIPHSDNFLSTEFSLKLLFGSKDFSTDRKKRYGKLAAMADTLKKRCSLNC